MAETLLGYQTMARQYSVTQTTSITERTLTSIAMSNHGPFTLTACTGFDNAYKYVLSNLSLLGRFEELFEIMRLVRNTIHSNGVFSPTTGEDTAKRYKEKECIFQVGQRLGWYDNDMMSSMFEWISDAMWEIVTSPEVSSIPYTPVFQLCAK